MGGSQENARETSNISDPCERFAAEEAKGQEILYSWPGVKYASYNGLQYSILKRPSGAVGAKPMLRSMQSTLTPHGNPTYP